jgi:hypothetical protein
VELENFRRKIKTLGIYGSYKTTLDLELALVRHISAMSRDFVTKAQVKTEPVRNEDFDTVLQELVFHAEFIRLSSFDESPELEKRITATIDFIDRTLSTLRRQFADEKQQLLITFLAALRGIRQQIRDYWEMLFLTDQPESMKENAEELINAVYALRGKPQKYSDVPF